MPLPRYLFNEWGFKYLIHSLRLLNASYATAWFTIKINKNAISKTGTTILCHVLNCTHITYVHYWFNSFLVILTVVVDQVICFSFWWYIFVVFIHFFLEYWSILFKTTKTYPSGSYLFFRNLRLLSIFSSQFFKILKKYRSEFIHLFKFADGLKFFNPIYK